MESVCCWRWSVEEVDKENFGEKKKNSLFFTSALGRLLSFSLPSLTPPLLHSPLALLEHNDGRGCRCGSRGGSDGGGLQPQFGSGARGVVSRRRRREQRRERRRGRLALAFAAAEPRRAGAAPGRVRQPCRDEHVGRAGAGEGIERERGRRCRECQNRPENLDDDLSR